ncbi:Zn-dependent hydrolase [Bacillus sp. FJAT-27264]|uniref:MBL fold metallo-hydrolase n=1 Tax=Paenibacillus sp. (strain DSM 101736 / FJAT-27264) TaxID=1850362 RepID=UPI000807EBBD|nr:MBL fold metallo-hydrolase [Bacillus sp. FJAT-27264]OBZ08357.1 Zn-dependent hydrolase [Bacillus sp. FJAT-27264]
MKIEKIKNRSVMFTTRTTSGWDLNVQLILGDKYNYIIDTGLGSLTVAAIKEYIGHDTKPIIVINTHYHWDHIWGNSSLQDCMIISHKLCREMIEQNWETTFQKYNKYLEGEAEMHLPNLTFEQELYFPEDKIRLIYTPGHTVDSISVIDEVEKVINVGDNIGDSVDEIVPSLYGEKEDYISTLLKYREMEFDTCISGHNIVLDKQVIDRILSIVS